MIILIITGIIFLVCCVAEHFGADPDYMNLLCLGTAAAAFEFIFYIVCLFARWCRKIEVNGSEWHNADEKLPALGQEIEFVVYNCDLVWNDDNTCEEGCKYIERYGYYCGQGVWMSNDVIVTNAETIKWKG